MKFKKIGVLTSGGDAPGMNAAVRAVVRGALSKGMEIMGIRRGYSGLINKDVFDMEIRSVSEIIHRGGTFIHSARCPEFNTEEGLKKAADNCKELGIEGIVVIGGDGSYRGARDLSKYGIPCIGIPGTIDNDIGCTEYTIGFDTAMNTAVEMIDRLRDTAQSHERCSICEVMGRNAGYLALHTGIAVGALAILVPEVEVDLDSIINKMRHTKSTGKRHFIIVVAEGIGHIDDLAEKIHKATGIETRTTVLGHIQRGGSPLVRDRYIASQMGYMAAELFSEGISNRIIAVYKGEITHFDINEALNMTKEFDYYLYKIAHDINI